MALSDAINTNETYDLIVVGGGISGLAAAHYFREKAGPDARVLVLDNHDDFGGHAKRNEFTHNGRIWIGYGGTQSIDSPRPYSANAKALITDLGIDVSRYATVLERELYPSLGLGPAAPSLIARPLAKIVWSSAPHAHRRRSSSRALRCLPRCRRRSYS